MVIDADYRGPVIVALYNDSEETQMVPAGSRIAQLVIMSYLDTNMNVVTDLDDTERGEGGFGSTGVQ